MKNNILVYIVFLNFLTIISAFTQKVEHPDKPVFPANWTKPTEQPDHIILTFSGDPSTSQSVTWRTSVEVKQGLAQITLASAAPRIWKSASQTMAKTELMDASKVDGAEVSSNYHSVTFNGLIPDTLYAYRVGDGTHWSEWFQFRTASKKAEPFSFLYVGDAQNYILELWSRLIREGFSKAPKARFIVHAGDLVSEAHSERQWHEWFTAGGWIHGMVPSVPSPGNHEYRAFNETEKEEKVKNLSVQWKPQFTLPQNGPAALKETAYFFDYQGVRIISLNSNNHREEQVVWLDSVLKNNPNKWTIATFHHPIFSSAKERDNKELRDLWKPVFDKYAVDLVLQGHDHSYARGQAGPYTKNELEGVNTRDSIAGTVYVVSVSGGKMYTLKEDLWDNYEAKLERKAENTQLFQVIKVEDDKLIYEAFTVTGELYDAFNLEKTGKKGKNKFIDLKNYSEEERLHGNTFPVYEDKKD